MSIISQHVLKGFAANHQVHGETAQYLIDGEVVVSELDVVPGKSEAEAFDAAGLVTTIELQDFHVRSGDLTRAGEGITPERGHVLRITRDGRVCEFTVNHPDANRKPFRRADAHGVVLRLHTLQVDNPTPVAE